MQERAATLQYFVCVVIVPVLWWGFWLWFIPRCDCMICLCILMVHDVKWYISIMLCDVISKGIVLVGLIAIGRLLCRDKTCHARTQLIMS